MFDGDVGRGPVRRLRQVPAGRQEISGVRFPRAISGRHRQPTQDRIDQQVHQPKKFQATRQRRRFGKTLSIRESRKYIKNK